MSIKTLNGQLFAEMLSGGAANLNKNTQIVNDLNVFPIPDGDTGTNMFMTIDAGVSKADSADSDSLAAVSDMAAGGMLLGARGNSGVILSRIFAGLAKGFKGADEADVPTLKTAFECAVSEAYGAVSNPVEGTILTVLKDAVTYSNSVTGESDSINSYFDGFIKELKRSLERTPDLLDVLREAGVVDSGGAGLIYIAEGMKSVLEGEKIELGSIHATSKTIDLNAFTEDSVLKFGYCTEFLLRLQRSKIDIDSFDLDALIEYLNSQGDSVVAFREGTVVKVHVHTVRPGDIFNHCQKFGEFLTVKMENMTLQHNETHGSESFVPKVNKPHKQYGIVSVAAGKGVKDAFLSLGCDYVVDGGQSMNPSAEDFISAFNEVNADTIFVFPNNGNVILAANQAAELYKEADVKVVNSKTVGEGYAAISMLDTSSNDADAIIAELDEIIAGVVTGMVSQAVRDAEMDGVTVSKDNYIGYADGKIYSGDADRATAAEQLCESLNASRYDIMLLVYGESVDGAEAQALLSKLKSKYRRTEIVLIEGDQPVYDYIIILE